MTKKRDKPAKCKAKGVHQGKPWVCPRYAVSRNMCEGHNAQRRRKGPYAKLTPLRQYKHQD